MQIVVDSSVLVAALNESDSQHERGVAEIHAASKPIVVPEYIVAETCAVLIQKANKRLADSFVREMGSNRDFRMELSKSILRISNHCSPGHSWSGFPFIFAIDRISSYCE